MHYRDALAEIGLETVAFEFWGVRKESALQKELRVVGLRLRSEIVLDGGVVEVFEDFAPVGVDGRESGPDGEKFFWLMKALVGRGELGRDAGRVLAVDGLVADREYRGILEG